MDTANLSRAVDALSLPGPFSNLLQGLSVRAVRRMLWHLGYPQHILEVPAHDGRHWSLLADMTRQPIQVMGDAERLERLRKRQTDALRERIEVHDGGAFDMAVEDQSVDCIFSPDLLTFLARDEDRAAYLRECHRVTRRGVLLQVWVGKNLTAFGRRRVCHQHYLMAQDGLGDWVIHAAPMLEAEFINAGFRVVGFQDVLPGLLPLRTYALLRAHK